MTKYGAAPDMVYEVNLSTAPVRLSTLEGKQRRIDGAAPDPERHGKEVMRISKRFTVAVSVLAVGSLLYGMSSDAMARGGRGGGRGGGAVIIGGAAGAGAGAGAGRGSGDGGYYYGGSDPEPSSSVDCSQVPNAWWSYGLSCTDDFPGGNALLIHYKGREDAHDLEFRLYNKPGHDFEYIIYRAKNTNFWWNPNYYSDVKVTLADDFYNDTVDVTDSNTNNPLGDPKGNACLFEDSNGKLAWATGKPCTSQ